MWFKYLVFAFLLHEAIIDCLPSLPSIPESLENLIVLRRLTKLYTLRSKASLSETCEKQSQIYNKALYNGTAWALEMMDASSKLQAGIAGWNIVELGSFDQCLAIHNTDNNIKGKFCYTRVRPKSNHGIMAAKMLEAQKQKEYLWRHSVVVQPRAGMVDMTALRWSICIPDGCTASDVQAHLNKFFLSNENGTLFQVQEKDCQTLESQPKNQLTAGDWTVIGFLSAIGCIVTLSTVYDVFLYCREKKAAHPLLIGFSWLTNFKKFIKVNNNPDQLLCLNGIRFISMLWIIYGHNLLYSTMYPVVNIKDAVTWMETFWAWFTLGSTVSVDTFFLLSGCLLMYGFLKLKAKNAPFNVPFMYIHRYLRLTPMYAATMIFTITLFKNMSSGPMWFDYNQSEVEHCKRYWWSLLLYIQNWVNPIEMCVLQSWYLQIDMQCFLMAPLILLAVYKYPKFAPYIFGVLILIFTLIPIGIAWYYKFGPRSFDFKIYYVNTFARAGPWIIGLALGYILFHTKQERYQLNIGTNSVLWIGSLLAMLYIVFGNYEAKKYNYFDNLAYGSLFLGLHRNLWAGFVGLIIFACVQGYGGPVNWFLSLPMFQVLSRLTYCMYLTHIIVKEIIAPKRTEIYFSNFDMLHSYFGTVGIDLFVSLVCLLTFEAPFSVIDNVLIGGLSKLLSKRPLSQHPT